MTAEKHSLTRPAGGPGWNIWRGTVGAAYLAAAGFNLLFTLPQGDLSSFADNAWHPVLAEFVHQIVSPHHTLIMSLVVVFEAGICILLLGRGRMVDVGTGAAVVWVILLIPFLQPFPMAATNIGLALVQGMLLLRRYDRAIWEIALKPSQPQE